MTQIFVSHSPNDAECAEQIRQGLEAKGYSVWREPHLSAWSPFCILAQLKMISLAAPPLCLSGAVAPRNRSGSSGTSSSHSA